MLKTYKIPIFASLVIVMLFIAKSMTTLNLTQQDDTLKSLFGIMKFEEKIRISFITANTLPSSVIYEYAIYNASGDEIFSSLKIKPKDMKFSVRTENDRLFYKNFFLVNELPYFIVIAQKISNKKNVFFVILMLVFTLTLVIFSLYLSYLASIKPYKEAQKYMNNFFNDAMHELKTPLGIASMNLEMLGIENKHTNRIKNALKHMQITYEDVEYYIKRGYIKFPDENINISDYLRMRVKFLLSIADVKNIKVYFYIDPNLYVKISKLALQRVIDNTIINAIKYSPQNSKIIIDLKQDGDRILFKTQDFGQGIKDIKRVFKRHEREDMVQGGFGLGLSIVHEICNKYGIICEVQSEVGVGSTFSYKFKKTI
ncbi:Adaptive-response sensory-kinase SasA [Campylobacter majalis]|uniref:histidine kinase n=1 Tax=Campylobacter majalis TaxID=2790656 RepID=A0ABN7K556_9BACT|nr:HAMP domain-containing sensor histidine kinase [Campylobacter majalis]CAD7287570.1 Adaptive-response sensory-kinase SasA [Campylobacter majalis]